MPTLASLRQRGLTLVEMMTALAVGLLVILAATALLQNARAAYQDIDDANRVQETGRMALAHLADAVRQANHLPWETALAMEKSPALAPGLRGIDDSRHANELDPAQGKVTVTATGKGYNQSDILMLGFFGAPAHAAGSIANCSGAAVANGPLTETGRSWVIYYIAESTSTGNEPELRCRYQGKSGAWTSDALARGVEAMQLRYAVSNDDGSPGRWLDASAIDASMWQRVLLVRIALLVRGNQRRPAASGMPARSYDLFLADPGNAAYRFVEKEGDQRLRTVFQTTVFLRNAASIPAAQP